jgi:acetyl esterase/lipase
MTTTPLEKPLPPGRGRRRFAAIGYALRVIKALPAPLRERVLDSASGGVSAKLPPFPDVLRLLEAAGGVPDGRRWQERLLAERPDLRAVRTRDVSSDDGGRLRARLYLPPAGAPAPTAALVWVHGGAFVIGSLEQKEAHWPAIELAAAGIPVLSVDYRMCLDGLHYPAPQDDVLTAWRWAREHADQLGVTPSQLHLGGGSAGGCLVAGAALRLRDGGEPLPASLYLAYPVLQGHLPAATPEVAVELSGLDLPGDEWIEAMFGNWAPPAQWNDPYVAPGLADPAGLPPTYVLTCGRDPLRRGSGPFTDRLQDAGVPVWQDVFTGSEHAPLDRPGTPDGEQAVERLRTWLTGGVAAMEADRGRP